MESDLGASALATSITKAVNLTDISADPMDLTCTPLLTSLKAENLLNNHRCYVCFAILDGVSLNTSIKLTPTANHHFLKTELKSQPSSLPPRYQLYDHSLAEEEQRRLKPAHTGRIAKA